MPLIQHSIHIDAPIEKVYQAITHSEGIRAWWTMDADLEEIKGGKGVFRFQYHEKVETQVKILNLEFPSLVLWLVEKSFRLEQEGTEIRFDLRKEGKKTQVEFSQNGFHQMDETFHLMEKGWSYYLVSLKLYIETGKGAPSPFLDFSIMNKV